MAMQSVEEKRGFEEELNRTKSKYDLVRGQVAELRRHQKVFSFLNYCEIAKTVAFRADVHKISIMTIVSRRTGGMVCYQYRSVLRNLNIQIEKRNDSIQNFM